MPGPEIKDWPLYERLRAQGYSKEQAAKIANSRAKLKRRRRGGKVRR